LAHAAAQHPGAAQEEAVAPSREGRVVAREAADLLGRDAQREAEAEELHARGRLERGRERLPRTVGGGREAREQQVLDGALRARGQLRERRPLGGGRQAHAPSASAPSAEPSASARSSSRAAVVSSVSSRSKTRRLACVRMSAAAAARSSERIALVRSWSRPAR